MNRFSYIGLDGRAISPSEAFPADSTSIDISPERGAAVLFVSGGVGNLHVPASAGLLMKVATYNVNGINGRLEILLRWLKEEAPDIVCLQELKSPEDRFPQKQIELAGYGAIFHGQKSWNGVAILGRGFEPIETRRGLPGDPEDKHSRYIEAAINGMVVGSLYLPNGNPVPGPKFVYKLQWFDRLHSHAAELLSLKVPAMLLGDFNVIPTDLDVYAPDRWRDDALFRTEVTQAYQRLLDQGWTDALRKLHPKERVYTFWKYFRNSFARDAGLRLDHILLSPCLAPNLVSARVARNVRSWPHTSDHAPVIIEMTSLRSADFGEEK